MRGSPAAFGRPKQKHQANTHTHTTHTLRGPKRTDQASQGVDVSAELSRLLFLCVLGEKPGSPMDA